SWRLRPFARGCYDQADEKRKVRTCRPKEQMMFVAMNNFKVANGKAEEFERIWKTRESYLAAVPGFVRFALLRGDGEGEYISHSTWESRDAFMAWTAESSLRCRAPSGIADGSARWSAGDQIVRGG